MKRVAILLVLVLAVSLIFTSAYCFADDTFELTQVEDTTTFNIDSILSQFSEEYLNEYAEEEVVVIATFKDSASHSIANDLEDVEIQERYSFNSVFNGQSFSIKIKDIVQLSSLSYIESVELASTYYADDLEESDYHYSASSGTNEGIINNTTSYQGDGMVVAVIDSAFDTSHIAFSTISSTNLALTTQDISSVLHSLNSYKISGASAQSMYISDKIAYAYDYGEGDTDVYLASEYHGTHVAGIVAGSTTIVGVVPNAQLALMKVSDSNGAMTDDVIIAAIEDSIKLDVDVINLSLGRNSGFEEDDSAFYKAVKAAEESGISVVCAAGNEYTSANGSESGSNIAKEEYIDNTALSSPATYSGSISTASAEEMRWIEVGSTNMLFTNGYNSTTQKTIDFVEDLLDGDTQKTLDYVVITNGSSISYGQAQDYEGVDVNGKIVVVQRGGDITFAQKAQTAKDKGAIGIIVVNNAGSGRPSITMDFPICLVDAKYGDILLSQETKQIVLKENNIKASIAAYSSKGVTTKLGLGVDVSAYGSNIYSAVNDQEYAQSSGTSMASPNLAGAFTAVRQYIQENNLASTKQDVLTLANQLIMSNTEILQDINGVCLSPRAQGSGLVDLIQATESNAYITTSDVSKTKIELGDNLDSTITLNFTVHNNNDASRTYNINLIVLTELIEDGYLSGYDQNLAFTINSINGSTSTYITVPANNKLDVSITFTLTEESIEILNSFTNGTYIEGYINLVPQLGDIYSISCPFIGFYGDWDDAAVLDITAYDNKDDVYMRQSRSLGVYADSYYLPLGEFVFNLDDDQDKPDANEEYASLSIFSQSMYALGYIQLGLLRSAEYIEISVVDLLTGETVYTDNTSYVAKTIYYQSYDLLYGGDLSVNISPYSLDLYNNGQYEVRVDIYRTYDKDGENEISDTYTQKFYVDEESPEIENIEATKNGNKYLATFTLSDNHYIEALIVCTGTGSSATNVTLNVEDVYPITLEASGVGKTVTVTYDVTEAISNASNGYLYFYISDYAQNTNIYYYSISNWTGSSIFGTRGSSSSTTNSSKPTTESTITKTFEFTQTEIEVSKNSEVDLANNQYVSGYKMDGKYTWTSSDTSIVAIKNGKITGLQVGVAVVTIKDEDNNESTLIVKVNDSSYPSATYESTSISSYSMVDTIKEDKSAFFGINLSSTTIKLAPGESFEFSYSYSPYNYNYIDNPIEIIVEASNANLTIDGNKVTATSSGTTTLSVKANGTEIASYEVTIVDELYVENGILLACFASDSTINLDASIKAIGSNAFSYSKNVSTVNLNNATIIYKNAFKGNATIQTINGIENVTSIYANAFEGCSALTSLNISSATFVGENAFKDCTNLISLAFDNDGIFDTAYIASSAFDGCTKLDHFTIEGADTKNLIVDDTLIVTLNYQTILDNTQIKAIGAGALSSIKATNLDLTGMTSLQRIEAEAFEGNETLKKIILPKSLEYIGVGAFANCTSLSSVLFEKAENQELEIASYAFENTAIYTIDLSSIKTTYGDAVFALCKSLSYANLGSVEKMGEYTFAATPKLLSVVFEEGTEDIGTYTFAPVTISNTTYYHAALKKVAIPQSIEKVGEYVFAYCTALTFEEGAFANITEIGDYAFMDCTSLKTLNLSKVEKLGYAAFAQSSIQEVQMNRSMNDGELVIGELAFYQCEYLTTCLLPTNLNVDVKIEKGAFYQCKLLESYSKTTGRTSFPFISSPVVTESGINFDRVVSIGDYAFTSCEVLSSASLVACKEIGYAAFADCEKLKTVTIPVIETIGAVAFYQSAITTLEIPNTIKTIGQAAFCDTEVKVTLNKSQDYSQSNIVIDAQDGGNVVYIKQKDDTYMLIYYPKAINATTYTVLDNTAVIGEYAFLGNEELTSVVMNDDIKAIGNGAFYKCSSLTSVIFKGTTLPILLSLYSSNGTYCNFVDYDTDDYTLMIFVQDEATKSEFESNKAWSNISDYILVGDESSSLISFMKQYNEMAGSKITKSNKDDFEELKKAYDALSEEDKATLDADEDFKSDFAKMQSQYDALPASQKGTDKIVDNIAESTGLDTWVIILIMVGVAALVGASAIVITIVLMKKHYAIKRAKEQSRSDKSIEEIFGGHESNQVNNDFDIFEEDKKDDINDNDQGQN